MAKAKKRPSKNAKAALKILENSKLLDKSKEIQGTNSDQAFDASDSTVKTAAAHKVRPNKKRG